MNEQEFNLLSEPWIKVLTEDIVNKEVSLKDVLINAHKYKQLSGETVTQDAAVLRLLLAIIETIFYRYDADGTENLICEANGSDIDSVLDRWQEYYDKGAFGEEMIGNYMDKYKERFWLFHETTPFYQVPDLQYGSDYDAKCFVGNIKESNNKATKHHFSMNEGEALEKLGYGEAARWLIYTQAYMFNVKPASGLPKPEIPAGVGRMGRLGFIMAVGENLFETLMLNLCPLKDGELLWGNPKPVWENPICDIQAREIAIPDNIPEAYTLQSRRILLNKSLDNYVCGFRAMQGDFYTYENETNEQMTIWKSISDKKTGEKKETPKQHDPEKYVWREFPTIICHTDYNGDENRIPGVVRWTELLVNEGIYPVDRMITFKTIGFAYGDGMSYTLGDCFDDSLSLSAGLLAKLGEAWTVLIKNEIEKCEMVSERIRWMSDDICSIMYGKDPKKKEILRKKLIQEFYFRINSDFRNWLSGIQVADTEREQYQQRWERIAYNAARSVAEDYVASLGSNAYLLKNVDGGKSATVFDAYNRYLINLSKIYIKKA